MQVQNNFVQYTDLSELGRGAQMTLLGFRAFAFGGTRCCCLVKTFQNVLGDSAGGAALSQLREMARHLGNDGKRRLKLAAPGCIRVTHDESSILAALRAAQDGDSNLCQGHLTWLLARSPCESLIEACSEFAQALFAADIKVATPETINLVNRTEFHNQSPILAPVSGSLQ